MLARTLTRGLQRVHVLLGSPRGGTRACISGRVPTDRARTRARLQGHAPRRAGLMHVQMCASLGVRVPMQAGEQHLERAATAEKGCTRSSASALGCCIHSARRRFAGAQVPRPPSTPPGPRTPLDTVLRSRRGHQIGWGRNRLACMHAPTE